MPRAPITNRKLVAAWLTFSGLGLLGLTGTALAAKVKVWQPQPAASDKAQFKQTVVSSEGTIRLARQLRPLASLDAMHVWDVVEDRDGNLFVATGDEGCLYKVTPDQVVSVAYQAKDSQVLCLAQGSDGSIYAGTGPSGHIIHLGPDGTARVLCQTGESYVWALVWDGTASVLYAGTGPKGRIYRVTPQGECGVFYRTRQEHILSLAAGPDGTLYAGTDKNGLVYRIDRQGKGFVLYSAPQPEVRSLLVTPEGVYAGTSAPTRRRLSTSSGSGLERGSPVAAVPTREPKVSAATSEPTGSATAGNKEKEAEKPAAAAAPAAPASGENSLYHIRPDGTVRELFREKALMLCLLKQSGRLYVGTGMAGQLFEIDEARRERSELARLDHGQIHCICRRRDGSIVLGTGDPGRLYVLQDHFVSRGTMISEVLDAKLVSRWGSLRWHADTPKGTRVSVACRSGNVAEPDDTWSDWSAEQTDPAQAVVAAPPARFLQYRVTLTTDDPRTTPSLHHLSVRYATTNHAPEVTAIEVPDLDQVVLEQPKKLKFKWTAVDANEDELTYRLLVRKDGWRNWVELEDDWEKREYEWDTTTVPAGTYQLRVVASDRRDNPDDEALTGEKISAPFVVAHVPPTVTVKVVGTDGDRAIIEATATDPSVRLTAASFALNGRKWVNVFPTDGLFDSRTETFRFLTEVLKPGTYVGVLRVRDADGNVGTGDVIFTVQSRGPAAK
ncbi:MAG: hypothetical protein NZ700_00410 [Gemmataceae bacterium]|nr:hypothetical protein [Gemmataceae bacterium]